jgi:hypothetical protein
VKRNGLKKLVKNITFGAYLNLKEETRLLTRQKVKLKANVTHRTGNEGTFWETVCKYTPNKTHHKGQDLI